MEKLIVNFKKGIVQGLGFFLVACLFVFGFYLVKGWNGLQATDGDQLTAQKWNELVGSANGAPSGFIGAFNLTTCPTGWKEANGTDSSLDLRGVFLRGLDNGKGYDSGRTLGTYQEDEFKSHSHSYTMASGPGSGVNTANGTAARKTLDSGTSGGTETRPKNVAVLYCVKE